LPTRPSTHATLQRSILDESKASNSYLKGLDCSCFNGIYVTELGTDYLANLARSRTFDRGDAVAISASNSLDTLQACIPRRASALQQRRFMLRNA